MTAIREAGASGAFAPATRRLCAADIEVMSLETESLTPFSGNGNACSNGDSRYDDRVGSTIERGT
jgi:hypothetical protein